MDTGKNAGAHAAHGGQNQSYRLITVTTSNNVARRLANSDAGQANNKAKQAAWQSMRPDNDRPARVRRSAYESAKLRALDRSFEIISAQFSYISATDARLIITG